MDETGDNGASLTLTADASPFEAALDRAGERVSAWSSGLTSKFDALSASIGDRTAAITGKITGIFDSINERAAGGVDLAESIGSVLGGAAGLAVFGPVGAKIGATLGGELSKAVGEHFDLEGLFTGLSEGRGPFGDMVSKTRDDLSTLRAGIEENFADLTSGIRDALRGIDLTAWLNDDASGIEKRWNDLVGNLGSQTEEAVGLALTRLTDAIDTVFGRWKEPVAGFVDGLQNALAQFGWIEAGTEKWGDALRGVEEVGTQVFVAIARGVGYVEVALQKAGAVVANAFVVPFSFALEQIGKLIADQIAAANDLSESLGAGRLLGEAEEKVRNLAANAGAIKQRAFDFAVNAWGKEFGAGADAMEKWAAEFHDRWQAKNAEADWNRLWDKMFQELWDNALVPAAEAPAVKVPQVGLADPSRRADAAVAGSRDAIRMLLADSDRSGAIKDPAERAAKAAEEQARLQRENNKLVAKLVDKEPVEFEMV